MRNIQCTHNTHTQNCSFSLSPLSLPLSLSLCFSPSVCLSLSSLSLSLSLTRSLTLTHIHTHVYTVTHYHKKQLWMCILVYLLRTDLKPGTPPNLPTALKQATLFWNPQMNGDGFKVVQGLPCSLSDHSRVVCFDGTNLDHFKSVGPSKPDHRFKAVLAHCHTVIGILPH